MTTYLMLNLVFFLIIGVAYVFVRPVISWRHLLLLMAVMLLLTVIFDNLIIVMHIVAYRPSHLLGLYIWRMPIEDTAYTVAACLLIPLCWGTKGLNVKAS